MPCLRVELPVGQAEAVSGEHAPGGLIDDTVMMPGMTLGMDKPQAPTRPFDDLVIGDGANPRFGNRPNLSVELLETVVAVHRAAARFELCGVRHVGRAPGMQYRGRLRACRHQVTGAARVIQVNVGHEHIIHVVHRQSLLIQGRQQKWNRMTRPGIDERRPPVLNDQVTGIQVRPHVVGIDRADAGMIGGHIGRDAGAGRVFLGHGLSAHGPLIVTRCAPDASRGGSP